MIPSKVKVIFSQKLGPTYQELGASSIFMVGVDDSFGWFSLTEGFGGWFSFTEGFGGGVSVCEESWADDGGLAEVWGDTSL